MNKIQFILGGYRFHWGSGLLFASNPMNLMSTSGNPSLYSNKSKYRTYSGSNESNYLFGPAITYKSKYFSLFTCISNKTLDATIENGRVKSINITGLHVTKNQKTNKNNLNNKDYAIGINVNYNNHKIGIMTFISEFEFPLETFSNNKRLDGSSFFYQYNSKDYSFNSEIAQSNGKSFAFTNSFLYRMEKVNYGISLRYLPVGFDSFRGSIIRNYGGKLENEKGFYQYFGFQITETLRTSVFWDIHSRLEPLNPGSQLENGTKTGFYLNKRIKRKSYLELRFSRKNAMNIKTRQWNLKYTITIFKKIQLINLLIYKTQAKNYGHGFSTYTKYQGQDFSLTFGTTTYFIENSNARLYIYEPGIPLKFNMVTLVGSGRNTFLSLNKNMNSNIKLLIAAKQIYRNQVNNYYFQLQMLVAL